MAFEKSDNCWLCSSSEYTDDMYLVVAPLGNEPRSQFVCKDCMVTMVEFKRGV